MRQELWIPGPLPTLNELLAAARSTRGRGSAYATLKRQWGDTVWALARSARLKLASPAVLSFEWRERDKRRDPDNFTSAGRKLILDGLVKAGVLSGDGWGGVAGFSDRWVTGAPQPGVLVMIEGAAQQP